MNRNKLLAISFALVLIGTLAIQGYWIASIVDVRTKQFDDAVFSAMHATVSALEQQENVSFIDSLHAGAMLKNFLPEIHDNQNVQINVDEKGIQQLRSHQYEFSVKTKTDSRRKEEQQHVKTIMNTIVVSSDSNLKVQLKNDSVELGKKLSRIGVIINKMSAKENGALANLPNGKNVEKLLKKYLKQHNIQLPLAIAMKGEKGNDYYTKNADSTLIFQSAYSADLFPNDVFKREGKLFVHFDGKSAYIFANMTWVLVILLLFTLLLIVMFYKTLSNYRKQKNLNALKSDFINNMTHEFKTPLATIQLAADVILKQSVDQDQIQKMAQTIKLQSKRIDEDVKNMLQVAMLENNQQNDLHRSTFDLDDLLVESAKNLKLIAEQKHVALTLDVDQKLSVSGDWNLLLKAISNLLDNAVKYSEEGQEVVLGLIDRGAHFEIYVKDSGCGIAKEDLPHVFEAFYRAGRGDLHHNKGYGLGLNFVQKIVALHSGEVHLTSEKGKGTEIVISIPKNNGEQ